MPAAKSPLLKYFIEIIEVITSGTAEIAYIAYIAPKSFPKDADNVLIIGMRVMLFSKISDAHK